MTARIYKPARTAMQSGQAKTKEWMLDYEPELPRTVEPLMGWTSSADMKQQVQIAFDTKEEAVAFCEQQGIPYQVFETTPPVRPRISYSDNFAYPRREAGTHCPPPRACLERLRAGGALAAGYVPALTQSRERTLHRSRFTCDWW